MIDEFASSIGRIPDFDVRLNTLRSRRVGVIAAVQSLGQLERVYGDGTPGILAGFSTKVFLAALERGDAEYASSLAGTTTVEATVRRTNRDRRGRKQGETFETVPVGRRLLTPEDIDTPPEHFELGRPATVFLPGMRPVQAWFTPSYRMPACIDAVRHTPTLPRDRCRAFGPLPTPRPSSWNPADPEASLTPLEVLVRSYADRMPARIGVRTTSMAPRDGADGLAAAKRFARERLAVRQSGPDGRKRWSALQRWSRRHPLGTLRFLGEMLAARMPWAEFMKAYDDCPSLPWRRTFELAMISRADAIRRHDDEAA